MAADVDDARVDLNALIREFHKGDRFESPLGHFTAAASIPRPYDGLLDHDQHMTVTVEAFHQCVVDVDVLRYQQSGRWYVREILLRRRGDGVPVQYGIVRFDTKSVAPDVWSEIESRDVPLGHVLIRHDVHRHVKRCRLWKIITGPVLSRHLAVPESSDTYGRTARIHCNGLPAIELLEVMIPGLA